MQARATFCLGMSHVVLETDLDREVENYVLSRLLPLHDDGVEYIKTPDMSACDYLVKDGRLAELVEIKTRKEPAYSVRKYGGLILKQRKAEEMATLGRLLNVPATVVFAFGNGRGSIYQIEASRALDLPAEAPPVRRNYRGLSCDEEPVYFLDWDRDLELLLPPEDN